MTPTFLKRDRRKRRGAGAAASSSPKTSEKHALSVPAQCRSKARASKADALGYRVGGKTGTAEKVINGRYAARTSA